MAEHPLAPDEVGGVAGQNAFEVDVRLDRQKGWMAIKPLPKDLNGCWVTGPFVTPEGRYYVRLERGTLWMR